MSETQKWIASISGAVVGQVIVLLFFMLMIVNPEARELSLKSAAPPKEVTIMLSELMEQVQPEPPEVIEPEQPKPAVDDIFQKQFINTDSNTAAADAPENARFESDRNTVASTQFRPDKSMPQVDGPTLRGEEKTMGLSLKNQDYEAGEEVPTPPPAAPPQAKPVEQPPAESESNRDDPEPKPGEADKPPLENEAEKLAQPESEIKDDTPKLASTTEEFMEVASGQQAADLAETEEEESAIQEKADEIDKPASPKQKQEIKASPVFDADKEFLKRQKALADQQEALMREYTESIFNPAYRDYNRQSSQNGNVSRLGEGSVDAESTAIGAYKKTVSNAIGKVWHQYRTQSGVVSPGFLRVQFQVTSSGSVRNVKVLKKEADTLLTEFSLKAIHNAKIPPMPAKVSQELGLEGLKMDYNIVIY